MPVKVAINGYGRIGRNILRALYESGRTDEIRIVAVNDLGDAETITRGFFEDDKTKVAWNLPRLLMAKNRVKLLLNMLLIAGQTIPRGGQLTVDPIGEGETMGFKVTAAGPNAKIGPAVPPLLAGEAGDDPLDAHRIQPFYAGLLARECGMSANLAMEGDAVVASAK